MRSSSFEVSIDSADPKLNQSLSNLVGNRRLNLFVCLITVFNTILLILSHFGTSGVIESNIKSLTGSRILLENESLNSRILEASSESNDVPGCSNLQILYEVQFVDAISKAWSGGAWWLALLLGIASGFWPYLKNGLIIAVWFRPMQFSTRNKILEWLSRLGKWSYVDVFIMVLFNSTLRVEKMLSTKLALIVVAYPRSGIYYFCIAATLSLIQSEWMSGRNISAFQKISSHSQTFQQDKSGRLRSGWRVSLAQKVAQARVMNQKSSLQVRLLLPAFCILALVIGCYAMTIIDFELQGTISLLPGNNMYEYSVDEIMRSLFYGGKCVDTSGSSFGSFLLFILFFTTVLSFPTVVCVSTSILWILESRGSGLEVSNSQNFFNFLRSGRAGASRLASTADLCAVFSCIDVFVFSLLVVAAEIDKVVRAVGDSVHIQGLNIDMRAHVQFGAYFLVVAIILFWATRLFTSFEEEAFDQRGPHFRVEPIDIISEVDEDGLYDEALEESNQETNAFFSTLSRN